MHYFTFHPKDYMSKTRFLTHMEDLAYRRMLDYQYLNEAALPADVDEIAMLIDMRTHSDSIAVVLRYFFKLTDDGYINDRVEQELAKYQEKSDKARKSAEARWKKPSAKAPKNKGLSKSKANASENIANAMRTHSEGNANQEPLTNNQKPLTNINIPFDVFWNLYDYKKSRAKAETLWQGLTNDERQLIIEHVPAYVASTPDKEYRKHPTTYLNNQCWTDEVVIKKSNNTTGVKNGKPEIKQEHASELEYLIGGYNQPNREIKTVQPDRPVIDTTHDAPSAGCIQEVGHGVWQ